MYSRTNASSRPTVDTKYPRAQKLCPTKFCFRPPYTRARCIALFPLMNPITCATAYLGGIEIIMCTWSGSRCPSSIRLSFCSASLRNTSPKYFLRSPYNAFRRPFGINTTWYLHSHFEWLKLSYSSIQFLLCVCFAAHARSFLDGLPYLSNFACLPGRAGGTPISLGCFSNGNGRIIAHGGDKMKIQGNALARNVTLAIMTFSMICAIGVHAQTYKVLHTFNYTDGSQPIAPLVFDPQGNLYGTTFSGGLSGYGTVFKLSPNGDGTWTESVLHNFDTNGDEPGVPLVLDVQGNIYGETPGIGADGSYGTVFELSPSSDGTWTEHIIHSFTNGRDGAGPNGGVVLANGNKMYGVAEGGATHLGLVFSLDHISATNWHELVLHPFTGGADGEYPGGPLTLDSSGDLYGVTAVSYTH